nr:PASTA domain-containing protein [Actinomycetota bacterium]
MDRKTTVIAGVLLAVIFGASLLSTLSFTKEQAARTDAAPTASPPEPETNIVVPDYVTAETSVATSALEALGLIVEEAELVPPKGLWGEVEAQEPAAGTSVLPGSRIILLSSTPDRAPLKLPKIERGEPCRAEPAHFSRRFRQVIGRGPIRLASATESGVIRLRGTRTRGDNYRTSALWTTEGTGFKGDALVRGDKISGPGGIVFEQDPEYTPHGPVVH